MKLFLIASELELPNCPSIVEDSVIFTGIGKTNAAMWATKLCTQWGDNLDLIVNVGTAGSFNEAYSGMHKCGTFVNLDGDDSFNNERYVFDKDGLTIGSSDSFVDNENLYLDKPDLVDMESFAIAHVCHNFGVNFVCHKYITDYIGSNSVNQWLESVKKAEYEIFKIIYSYI